MPSKKPRHSTGGWAEGHEWNRVKLVALCKKYKPDRDQLVEQGLAISEAANLMGALSHAMAGYSTSVKIWDQAPTQRETRAQIQHLDSKVEALIACLEGLHDETKRALRREGMGGGLWLGLDEPLRKIQNCAAMAERKLDEDIAKRGNRGGGRPREYALDNHLKLIADVWKEHMPEWFKDGCLRHGCKKQFLYAILKTLEAAGIKRDATRNLEHRLAKMKVFGNSPENG